MKQDVGSNQTLEWASISISGSPGTVVSKYLLFTSHPIYRFLLQQPEQTEGTIHSYWLGYWGPLGAGITQDRISVLNENESSPHANGGGWHLVPKFKTKTWRRRNFSVFSPWHSACKSNIVLVHTQVLRTTELLKKRSKSSTSRCPDNRAKILPLRQLSKLKLCGEDRYSLKWSYLPAGFLVIPLA